MAIVAELQLQLTVPSGSAVPSGRIHPIGGSYPQKGEANLFWPGPPEPPLNPPEPPLKWGGSAVLGGGVPSWGVLGKVGFCAAGAIFLALEHFSALEGGPEPPLPPPPQPPSSGVSAILGGLIGLFRVSGGMTPLWVMDIVL